MTTNHIQGRRLRPCTWSHSPHVHYRLPKSLSHHYYATPMSSHHLVSPQPNLEHHRPRLNEYSHTRATSLSILLAQAHVRHTRLLEILAKSSVIVALLYLVPFHLCTPLFLPRLYCCPVPTLSLSLYLLHLVV